MVDISFLAETPYPEGSLVIGGLIALALAIYGKRDDSVLDEIGTFVAFALGVGMLVICAAVVVEDAFEMFSVSVMLLLAICLFMRPLRGISWSSLLGLIVASAVTYAASLLLPSDIFGVEEWKVLVAIFLIVGTTIYLATRFFEVLVKLSTAVLSWRASISLIGALALAEGLCLVIEGESLISLI